ITSTATATSTIAPLSLPDALPTFARAVAAALVVLPASWLAAALPAHWPLAIVDTQGTVWKGTAAVAIGPAHQRRRLSEPLRWEWSFSRGPQLAIQHRWLSGPLTLALTP